jgi:hypothetical protein
MLIRPDGDGALVIGQLSHSWLAGQLARAWGNERFGELESREELVLGAEQHDVGWAAFDLEPRLNPDTGLPLSFLEISAEQHLQIWRDAPDHLLSQSLRAALLVSLHGSSLSQLRARRAPEHAAMLQAHVEQERARQSELTGRLSLTAEQVERDRALLWAWDGISLALCCRWRPFTATEVPSVEGPLDVELRELEAGACTLDPWPFTDERLEVHCEARRLEGGYRDESAMRAAYAAAEPVTLRFVLAAP